MMGRTVFESGVVRGFAGCVILSLTPQGVLALSMPGCQPTA